MSKSSLLPASCFCLPKVMGADSDLTPAVQVVVNGTPFHEFKHRIPLQMVTHLHVDGDLMLQSINFIGGQPPSNQMPMPAKAYPSPGQYYQQQSRLPTMEGPPAFNPVRSLAGV